MQLLRFDDVMITFGDAPLLDSACFQLNKGERVCLIGRNGTGKSTLFKCITGDQQIDDGFIWKKNDLRVGILRQDLPIADDQTVYQVVASGLSHIGDLLSAWHECIESGEDINKLERIQHQIETNNGWLFLQRIDQVIQSLDLPANKTMGELSGGWRRRVELAQALVKEPDLLLLDEPTNHLDVVTIAWLEKELKKFNGAILFITHDRSFLKALSTRILNLDRGQLVSYDCDYETFLERKAAKLETEATHNSLFDKKLADEETWIRQGIKARRTRNEGRVRALKTLREERMQRRNLEGKASFVLDSAEKSGKLVVELQDVVYRYDDNLLVDHLNFTLIRGDKVGLIGGNGVGKSTLLNILMGALQPQSGSVSMGTKVEMAYFDQMREQLDLTGTVVDNVSDGRDRIEIGGKSQHVISYLEGFLFSPKRSRVPVKALSGGERNRLLLARLFSKEVNLLVMDEPTNDLDMETLELLENILVEYKGTLLLVSHDRSFLDNVVTSSLFFKGNGIIEEGLGGVSDWLAAGGDLASLIINNDNTKQLSEQKSKTNKLNDELQTVSGVDSVSTSKPEHVEAKKLSYKLKRELELLPGEVERLESERNILQAEIASPEFYKQDKDKVRKVLLDCELLEKTIEEKMERWMELEQLQ